MPTKNKYKYPSIEEILTLLWESPWDYAETREELSMRILTALSNLPADKWLDIPPTIQKWYDKSRTQLIENKRVFYYPDPTTVPVSPTQELGRYKPSSLFTRIAELVLMDYTLTCPKVFDILQTEGRKTTLRTVEAAFYNIKALLGILQTRGLLDVEKFYPKSTNKLN